MADKIAKLIKDIINVKQQAPTEMKWKEEESTRSGYQGNIVNERLVNNGQDSDVLMCDKHTDLQAKCHRSVQKKNNKPRLFLWTQISKA
jgi:hypothetical protein